MEVYMRSRLILQDLVRNKAISAVMVFFIAITAALLSLVSALSVNLFGSIDALMQTAKTPHFMQMHSGEIDQNKLELFATNTKGVESFQILPFLGIDSEKILVNGTSLVGTLQDNGVCTQSKAFDFLLDLDGNPAYPLDGEIYAPVFYSKDKTIQKGDAILIGGKTFTVAGFVRDSQMNAALAYSKRFVVSPADYAKLEPLGAVEALIEFRLNDIENIGSFETAYSKAGLPANGPTLTWPLFRMISAMSDGIMIAVIGLVSILLILIALLCIRFTLLAKIEDDYQEIGTMKAIGIRLSEIRGIYLSTYGVLAAVGCILGFALSFVFYEPMLEGIRLNFGDSGKGYAAVWLGIIAVVSLFGIVLLYIRVSLERFQYISAAEALRFGMGAQSGKTSRIKRKLSKNRLLSTNVFLGISDVMSRKRLYGTMLAVVMLGTFIIVVPQNLYHTISAKTFVTYMGIGRCDLRIDMQQNSDINGMTERIEEIIQSDADVSALTVLTTKTFGIKREDGKVENLKVELGNHAVFPVMCANGKMPTTEQEIALSSILADEWGKSVGDVVTLLTAEGEKTFSVCGVYSDITNGGKTAKAIFTDNNAPTAWSIVCVSFVDQSKKIGKLAQYKDQFDFARVSSIDDYISQTFGQTLRSVRIASLAAIVVAVAVTLLVTLLFLKLLIAKDSYRIAVIKAIGYTNKDLERQFAVQMLWVATVGIVLGTILAGTLGEKIVAMAISSFGAAAFQFEVNLLGTFFFCPVVLLLTTAIATMIGTGEMGEISISKSMKG